MKFELVRPSLEHQAQYEEMMDEWEAFGGRLNPGALRRYSYKQQKIVPYSQWLEWIAEDRVSVQDLYFFMGDDRILGAISVRTGKTIGIHGHTGYGIRPSERRKGYATKMLAMALGEMKEMGINPAVVTCAQDNGGSMKVIMNNGGVYVKDEIEEDSGEVIKVFQIQL